MFRRNTDFVPGAGGAGNQKAMREVCQRRRNGRASTKMTAGAVRHAFPPNARCEMVRVQPSADPLPIKMEGERLREVKVLPGIADEDRTHRSHCDSAPVAIALGGQKLALVEATFSFGSPKRHVT